MDAPERVQLRRRLNADATYHEALRVSYPNDPLSYRERVLRHGQEYISSPLDLDERAIVSAAIAESRKVYGRFRFKQCFWNAQALVLSDETRRMGYAEGHVLVPPGVEFHHGWATIGGKVVDVTVVPEPWVKAREPSHLLGAFAGRAYAGVPFAFAQVREAMLSRGALGSLFSTR